MEKGTDYSEKWKEEPALLRSVIDKKGLDVAVKWGIEAYIFNGRSYFCLNGNKICQAVQTPIMGNDTGIF